MPAGPPTIMKTQGRMKAIMGIVSKTGRRAARSSNLVSAAVRISLDRVRSESVNGVPYCMV